MPDLETIPDAPIEEPSPATEEAAAPDVTEPDAEPVDPEYLAKIKDESIKNRLKAKKVDAANAALIAAYVQADGRLLDSDAVTLSDDLLTDGLVDPGKVADAVSAVLIAKPMLHKRTPVAPLPGQGVSNVVEPTPGLFDLMRGL